jgi:sulfite exporter TauE/SafE
MQGGLATAALVMGLAGGPHCVAMCGAPTAGVIRLVRAPFETAAVARPSPKAFPRPWRSMRAASQAMHWPARQRPWRTQSLALASTHVAALKPLWILLHAATLAWGVALVAQGRQPAWAHRFGKAMALRVRPLTRSVFGVLATGALWVLMPCGLLYSALALASLGNGALDGAMAMTLFALGSGLSLAAAPWACQGLGRRLGPARERWGARIAGVLLALMALDALWMDLGSASATGAGEQALALRQRNGNGVCGRDDSRMKPMPAHGLLAIVAMAWVAHAGAMDASCLERADGRAVDFVAAAAREAPSVVTLVASGVDVGWSVGQASDDEADSAGVAGEPWRTQGAPSVGRSTASGIVIRQDGFIVTSAHAVAGAHDVTARLADGRGFRASIVGIDSAPTWRCSRSRRPDWPLRRSPAAPCCVPASPWPHWDRPSASTERDRGSRWCQPAFRGKRWRRAVRPDGRRLESGKLRRTVVQSPRRGDRHECDGLFGDRWTRRLLAERADRPDAARRQRVAHQRPCDPFQDRRAHAAADARTGAGFRHESRGVAQW